MFTLKRLLCEYMENPIGIDILNPRISWQLDSNNRNVMQKAYQIQVSMNDDFEETVWDSGKVISDQSVHVEIQNLKMAPCTRYNYRVQVWNENGDITNWSNAYWETGLLDSSNWVAEFIGAPKKLFADENISPQFRRSFNSKGIVEKARVYATGLGIYELSLNGNRIGENYFTPGWTNYRSRLQYQTYDVTSLIQGGENVIGSLIGNGWYMGKLGWKGKESIYGDRKGLLLELHLWYEDGSKDIIKTDEEWKVYQSPILMSEIYHGETYDARLEEPGWSVSGYQDKEWSNSEIINRTKQTLVAQENLPVRKMEEIKPIKLVETPNGEKVLDMGQNMVGWMHFTVKSESGTEVILKHAEVLDNDGSFYTDNLRQAEQQIRYIVNGEENETYEPHFTFQGFRYVQLIGFNEPINLDDFTGIVLHSEMERTGYFECSNPLINQLQHNIVWGQKGNFLDIPTDCPQRDERLGWTGDAQMFVSTAAYLRNVAPFFSKWLKDLKSEQLDDGGVPFVIPQILEAHRHSSSAWGDAAVICPWTMYQNYGDTKILEQQYESMKAWVEYIRQQGDNEFLWNTGFHYGDWLGLDSEPDSYRGATDNDLIATAFYAYSVSLLQKTATVLNKTAESVAYAQLHVKVIEAFREEFVTPSGRLVVPTQTAQILAIKFDLLDGRAKERAINKLVELLKKSGDHLKTGFVGTPYINFVLSEAGHNETAYNLLLQTDYPSWLYQVEKGATTIWEHWDGIKEDGSFWSVNMNSFNHYAYGAIGDWLYRCVAGINTDEEQAGFKQIRIHPYPDSRLTWAEGRFDSMYGTIRSAWKKHKGAMELNVTIPPNTTASVFLPEAKENAVKESNLPIHDMSGLHTIRTDASGTTVTLGSGVYNFYYEIQANK